MQRFFKKLMPFIILGIIIVAIVFGAMLLAYLFIFGALLGLFLYAIRWIRDKFFSSHHVSKQGKTKGRIIDSNDWKKL